MLKLLRNFDPRWILFTNHALLLSTGVLFFNLNRSAMQIFLGLSAGVVAELALARIFNKEQDRLISRLLSAFIIGLGFLILTYSDSLWYYPAGITVAVLSKYVFRYNQDHHIFNPTGFAIVFAFAFFPTYKPHIYVDSFLVSMYPMLQVLFLGLAAVVVARKWVMSLTYYVTMLIGAWVLQLLGRHDFMNIIGPELSVVGLIIPFFMITDPRTSPKNYWGQLFWGINYGFWNLVLKDHFIYASNFISSFCTAAMVPLIRWVIMLPSVQARIPKFFVSSDPIQTSRFV